MFSIYKQRNHTCSTQTAAHYCVDLRNIGNQHNSAHYLVEESLWKLLEALGTHKAVLMVQLPITVDDLLGRCKATLTSLTSRMGQGISHAVVKQENTYE